MLRRGIGFLSTRRIELALFLLGALLRASMSWSYDVTWSYDAQWHWDVVEWILAHKRIPTPNEVFQAQHPPVFYLMAAGLTKLGVTHAKLVWLPIIAGTLRLWLMWVGFELYLPRWRAARIFALALAAVLPTSVHIDGMLYAEALSGLWLTIAMLLVPQLFRRTGRARFAVAAALGLVLGVALLTKISAVVVIGSILFVGVLELLLAPSYWRHRALRAASLGVMVAVCVAVSGWYFARNVRDFGTPFVTSFDVKSQHGIVAESEKTPYLHRRKLGFFFGWDKSVMLFPYYPSGAGKNPHFFPVAVASTFVDYWDYSFSGVKPDASIPGWPGTPSRPMTPEVFRASEYAVFGGTAIFLATVVAWVFATRTVASRRDFAMLALLGIPLFTLVAAIHFAIKYPIDSYGVVKGAYMHFGAPPLYGLFGLAVSWTLGARARWPLFGVLFTALWLVAAYSIYCRLRIPMVPLA
jgi:hypothetical protein